MSNKKGFTLIELLIVVVIIGILAAIAIPKFANTKEKAYLAAMKSDLRNMATYEEQYAADQRSPASGLQPVTERYGHRDRCCWPAPVVERDRQPYADCKDLRYDERCDHLHLIRLMLA